MRILLVAAHADDEISSAGTLTKFMQKGHEIFIAVFSFCGESSKALGQPEDVLVHEFNYSMDVLRLQSDHIFVHHYRVRHFPEHRQAILEVLVKLKKHIKPRLVLMPNTLDVHQDHRTMSEECRRAFRDCMLWGYESPRALLSGNHICYVKLSCQQLETKINCLRCYQSQRVRPGMIEDVRESLAKLRGAQAGHIYAEAFETIQLML